MHTLYFAAEINTSPLDETSKLDLMKQMYSFIDYSYDYSKTSESLWQYHRDETYFDNDAAVASNTANSKLLKFKDNFKGGIVAGKTTNKFEIAVLLE